LIRIELTIEIDRPVERVFAYVTDPSKLGEWQPNLIEATNETEGPLGRGTRLRETRRGPFGRTVEAVVEVAEYEPNARFDLRIVSGPLPIDGRHAFRARDGETRIDFVAEGQPGGGLRLAEPLLAAALRRQFRRYYERLKEVLEARAS
jgi:uncharacterized protein YndB with AHSA1/START domain